MFDENKPKLHKVIRILQILGGCLFVVAYFLPGISFPDEVRGLIGYKCAYVAITGTVSDFWDISRGKEPWREIWIPLLIGLSSLNNFLVPLYLLTKKTGRRYVGAAVVLSCVATPCAVFYAVNERPLLGCYLWLLGALLIVLPEATGRRSVRTIGKP